MQSFAQRSVALTLAISLVGIFSGCEKPPHTETSQPAMFRGDAAHSGHYSGDGAEHYGGLLWRVETGGPVRSSPTVFGDALYVGSGDGQLYAIDRKNGAIHWVFDAGAGIASSPAVTADLVFIASAGGIFLAVERATGHERWRHQFGADVPLAWGRASGDYYTSSAVLGNGMVIVGGGDGVLYAFEPGSGTVRWKFSTGGRIRSSPAIANNLVYVASFDGKVYALDLTTGALRWSYATTGVTLNSADFGFDRRSIQSSPAATSTSVYVGSRDGNFYALDAQGGTLRWKVAHDDGSWSISSPAVDDSLVYGGSSDAHFFHALRVSDGSQRWRVTTPGSVWSSPARAGRMVYFGDGSGMVHAVDAATGAERWNYRTGGGISSSPAVEGSVVYVGSGDGAVYAIRGGDQDLERAVFWDSTMSAGTMVRDASAVRDALHDRGYHLLDARTVGGWMTARIADRHPSVVVFAQDQVPAAIASVASDTVLLRRYLDAGGKVVWLGIPPTMWPAEKNGDRSYSTINWTSPRTILSVDFGEAQFDRFGARVTAEGHRWGLSGWWQSVWAVGVDSGLTVLATDENGRAAAWARSFGGPPGTGFVQLGRYDWPSDALRQLIAIAEYRPE